MAAKQATKIFIRNLPWTVGHQELREYFSQFGYVNFSKVLFDDKTGFSKKIGIVNFRDYAHCDKALKKSPHFLEGLIIRMDFSMQQEETDNLVELFNKASIFFASIASKVSSNDLLYIYSLYKQSIEGPCNIAKPGFFDLKGKQKWEAWKSLGNMAKEEAMQSYIDKLTELEPSWEGAKATQKSWVYVSRLLPEEEIKEENKTMFDYVRENNLEKVKLCSPAELKTCDANEMTALHWACDRGYEDIVKYLLQQQIDINCQDIDGQTPLHYAASCGHEAVVKLLVRSRAKKDIKDSDGTFAFDCAEDESIKSLLR